MPPYTILYRCIYLNAKFIRFVQIYNLDLTDLRSFAHVFALSNATLKGKNIKVYEIAWTVWASHIVYTKDEDKAVDEKLDPENIVCY